MSRASSSVDSESIADSVSVVGGQASQQTERDESAIGSSDEIEVDPDPDTNDK